MTALIITAIILALVILLLFADISFVFSYKDSFDFRVRFLFINLSGDKITEIIDKRSKNKPEKAIPRIPENAKRKKKSPSDIIDLISFISVIIKSVLGEFTRYARLKLCSVKISIATEDPASTAMIYGAASSALYTALEFLDTFLTVKKSYKNIGVIPDFTSSECRLNLKVILKLKIIHLLLATMHILPVLAKKGK